MSKAIAWMIALFLVGHGIIGLFIEGQHFLLFNVDLALDALYLLTGGALFFASRADAAEIIVRLVLAGTGGLYALIGVIGLFDLTLFGVAPTGLAQGDFLLFFGIGGVALLGAVLPHAERPIWEVASAGPDGA
jgi:hypothetical protein